MYNSLHFTTDLALLSIIDFISSKNGTLVLEIGVILIA